jgi:uncharacterized protein (TIGR02099 family)
MSIEQANSSRIRTRLANFRLAAVNAYRTINSKTHHVLGILLGSIVVVYFVFCTLFLSLRYVVLPNIDHYKTQVEQLATKTIGRPVSIATIHASWRGLKPHLLLNNVVIYDKDGGQALSLPKVSTTVSWWSVMVADLRLDTLEISRPDMDIERDLQGNLYVAGLLIDSTKGGDGKGADWVLSQREIVIRDGRVRWNDKLRDAPELVLNDVDLVLHNDGKNHKFGFKATPPAAFAAPIDVRAEFGHPYFAKSLSDIKLWKGTMYADWQGADLSVWKPYFDYPVEVQSGTGSVRAWLHFDHAKIADFTADLRLSNVTTRLRKDLQLLNLAQVSGRVSAREEFGAEHKEELFSFGEHGYMIELTDFSMETNDGLKLPTTTIRQSFFPATGTEPEKTEVTATELDLHTLANFIERLPLPAGQRRILADYSPRGQLKDFSAKWQGTYPAITSYAIKGRFAGLTMSAQPPIPARAKTNTAPAQVAVPGIPGFDNLSGHVDASEQGGLLGIASENAVLHLPGYFTDPAMPFESLKLNASWKFQDEDQLLFQVDDMDFVQDGVAGSLTSKHRLHLGEGNAKTPAAIDLSARISEFDVNKIGHYLPVQTPETLRHWLTGALAGGRMQDVVLVVKGNLADFPFNADKQTGKDSGQFSIVGKIDNGVLNYSPGKFAKDGKAPFWPLLEEIKGNLIVDRARMEIIADSAKTGGVALSNVKAEIPDLLSPDRLLNIEGHAAGTLQDFVRYVNESPVAGWIANFTEPIKAGGNAKLLLKLQMPLAYLEQTKVQGALQFAGNTVTLQDAMPPIMQTNGELKFNEKGFTLNGIKANFLGGPATLLGGTQSDGAIAMKVEGNLSSEGLRKTFNTPTLERLLQQINGSTRYSAAINVKKGRPEIIVESSMQGVALDFPAPLRKAANENMPLKFELNGLDSDDVTMLRDEIKLSLGSTIAARYLRQKSIDVNGSWQVVQGGIGVNAPAPQPDSGLIANVNLNSLNIDAWRKSVTSITGTETPVKTAPASTHAGALGIAQYIEPDILAARATELIVMGKKLDNVVVGASRQKGGWQANIDSEQASGYVTWEESRSSQGLGRVTARLASLIIPQSAASDVTDLLEGKNTSTQLPALDIVAEKFELFGKKFGHLELLANNVSGETSREWRIRKLSIVNSDAIFNAAGKWITRDGDSTTNLTYALDIGNAGKLLDRFGFVNVLRGGKGRMDGDIRWKGLPFSIDIPSLSGQLQFDMAAGQFLKVDPGAAKLLSVLSLQSLPRRLTLDFRDLFSEGFAFDGVVGTATITNGMMKTDNFKMRSISAIVLMDGSVDIVKESQNLHAVIIPEINAGAASLIYGLVINPVVGLGSFLAQLFLRDPLMRAFTVEYEITGPWKEPAIKKLDRSAETAPVKPTGSPAIESSNGNG